MGDVVDIEANLPHRIQEVICVRCTRRWLSVAPTSVLLKNMECSTGCAIGGVIATGCKAIMEQK